MKVLLDSKIIGLVISLEFVRRKGFKLKKIKRPIYVRNVDKTFDKEGLIEHTVEISIYYKRHTERIEIGIISRQKWNTILGILWLACYNSEIGWKTGEVKMMRCLNKCGK